MRFVLRSGALRDLRIDFGCLDRQLRVEVRDAGTPAEMATAFARHRDALLDGQGPGRAILLRQVVPLLDVVERFVRQQGRAAVRRDVPVRAAVLQIGASALMRAAAGSLREPLWGATCHAHQLARLLLLREPSPASS